MHGMLHCTQVAVLITLYVTPDGHDIPLVLWLQHLSRQTVSAMLIERR